MLEVKNLSVSIGDREILKDFNLTVANGEVAAIMGPNGSGKSTLSYVIAGKPDYEVTSGEVLLDGENILELSPDERAAKGVFLAFQYPVEIPGVTTMTFLKATLNAIRRQRGEPELSIPDFIKRVNAASAKLNIKPDLLKRAVNVGFSGGEKKRMDIFQMAFLEPHFAILDETDSGLDIDALQDRCRWRECLARQGSQLPRHHALSAPARIYRAGQSACDGRRPDRSQRRQGAGARTRKEWLQGLRSGIGVRP